MVNDLEVAYKLIGKQLVAARTNLATILLRLSLADAELTHVIEGGGVTPAI